MKEVNHELQVNAIAAAAKKCKLDAHIIVAYRKNDCGYTWANKIMGRWYRRKMPYKNSYMFCDTMDLCFFFNENNEPMYTYAGYADLERDAREDKNVDAFKKANLMLKYMKEEIERME